MKRFEGYPIFSGLSAQEIERVLRSSEELVCQKGHRIFEKGDPCDGFYVILDGSVEIRRKDLNGSGNGNGNGTGEVLVALLSTPSVFGEMSLIADRPRSAAAIAVEPVKLVKVAKKGFDELIAAGDLAAYKVIRAFARIITERLKVTEEQFVSTLKELTGEKREKKLHELQAFRQKLFTEWSF